MFYVWMKKQNGKKYLIVEDVMKEFCDDLIKTLSKEYHNYEFWVESETGRLID